LLAFVFDVAGDGTLAALPIPLGSATELLTPPGLPGPGGMPFTALAPAPAEPALGVPAGLVAVPVVPVTPWANALSGNRSVAEIANAIAVDFLIMACSPMDLVFPTEANPACSSKRRVPEVTFQAARASI
jgi:hypothetical protein